MFDKLKELMASEKAAYQAVRDSDIDAQFARRKGTADEAKAANAVEEKARKAWHPIYKEAKLEALLVLDKAGIDAASFKHLL